MSTIAIKVLPARGKRSDKPEVTCQPFASRGDLPWVADVLSIAGAEFRVATRRRFEPGTVLLVRAKASPQGDSSQHVARVANVSGPYDGNWVMDCQLASEPDAEFLAVLRRARRAAADAATVV